MPVENRSAAATAAAVPAEWLSIVRQKVAGLSFGAVEIVVHNGRVVQIDCTERVRMATPPAPEAAPTRRAQTNE